MSGHSDKAMDRFVDRLPAILFVLLTLSVVGLEVSIAFSSITFGLAGASYLFLVIVRKEFRPRTPLNYAVLAYCAVEILSTVFSIDKAASFVNMKRLFLIACVPMTMVAVRSESHMKRILAIVFAVTAALSCFEIVDVLELGPGVMRLGVFQHYMTAGGIKMFILLLMVPFLLDGATPARWRWWILAGFLPILLALILTETRSSWVGLIVGVGLYGLMQSKRVLFGLLLVIGLFIVLAPSHWKSRAFSIFDLHQYSNVERFQKWHAGLRMIPDFPIVGTGDIDLGQIYDKYKDADDPSHGGHLHNNFMMLIVTLGILGFGAVMYLFWKILTAELSAVRRTAGSWFFRDVTLGSLASYAGFHVSGLFEWNFGDHEIAVLLWFTVGLALAAEHLVQQQESVKPQ
ncbi:MAG TPA: O-antigen ligase family protein [Bacteroidota bacterium]|nr:O-antigen ligase family protein [Bacteroidota bacterium]